MIGVLLMKPTFCGHPNFKEEIILGTFNKEMALEDTE